MHSKIVRALFRPLVVLLLGMASAAHADATPVVTLESADFRALLSPRNTGATAFVMKDPRYELAGRPIDLVSTDYAGGGISVLRNLGDGASFAPALALPSGAQPHGLWNVDLDGDGLADTAYRPNDLIDEVLWVAPRAKLLINSPAVQVIRWAQAQFPALYPGGVVDSAPLMTPPAIAVPAWTEPAQ